MSPPVHSKRRALKNVAILSAGIMLLFTSYDGLAMLQSTVNAEGNVGIISQAVCYFFFAISALVLPKYVIKRLGVKRTLVLSMMTYLPYVASNFYPHWSSMIPTSVLIGLGASLLWVSNASYLNCMSRIYAELLLLGSSANESDEIGTCSGENEDVSVIFQRSVKSRGGYGSFSNEEDRADSVMETVKSGTDIQTAKDEKFVTPDDGNMHYQSDNKNEGINTRSSSFGSKRGFHSRTSSFGSTRNFRPRSKTMPQNILGGKNSLRDTKIDFNASDSNTILVKEHNQNSSIPESFDTSCFDANNDIDLTLKHSNPSVHSVVTSIPNFIRNKDAEDTKPIINKTEILLNRKRTLDSITARFFGFNGMAFLSCLIWSNLLSFYIMKGGADQDTGNSTVSTCDCGVAFCDQHCDDQHSFTHMADETRYLLTGICVGLGLLSVILVVVFLDPLDEEETTKDDPSSMEMLMATWNMAKNPDIIKLTPASLYIGMAQAFYIGDFTKAFVGCAWGTENVGLAAAVYGGACAAGSLASGWAVRTLGRTPVFASAALLNFVSCLMLLAWRPTREDEATFFAAATMWGIYVGIALSQMRALFGVLFKADEEAAFAAFHTWYSLGFFFNFAFSSVFCTVIKIWALLAVSTLGFAGYLLVERKYKDVLKSSVERADMFAQAQAVTIVVTPSSPDMGRHEVVVRQRAASATRGRDLDEIQ